jgi:hypothetical protein
MEDKEIYEVLGDLLISLKEHLVRAVEYTDKDRTNKRIVALESLLNKLNVTKRCDDVTYFKEWLKGKGDKFIVRLYDGFDNEWIDISEPLPLEEAMKIWRGKTNNGTEKYKYDHIDYYEVFPADTKMLHS